MPVLTVSEHTSPQPGFSKKRCTRPSASATTTPYSSGFSTFFRTIVASAPRSLWKAMAWVRSQSVSPSPDKMTKGWSKKLWASFTLPAVPNGWSSMK